MKLLWIFLLAVLVIGILLPFTLLKDDGGNTLLKFSDLKWPDWSQATKILPPVVDFPDPETGSVATIYQWVDTEGNMQFSNSLPPVGTEFTIKNYDSKLNVIQSVNVESRGAAPAVTGAAGSKEEISTDEVLGSPYSIGGIKKLFEDANNIEKLLNQKLKNQEAILGQ